MINQHIIQKPINKIYNNKSNCCIACSIAQVLNCDLEELSIPHTLMKIEQALQYILGIQYKQIFSLNQIRKYLLEDKYIILGYEVYNSLYNPNTEGMISFNPDEKGQGIGHCLVCCGFDDEKQALLCIEHKGSEYGIDIDNVSSGGLVWISYDYPIAESWLVENVKNQIVDITSPTNKYACDLGYLNTYVDISYEELLSTYFDKYGERVLLGLDAKNVETYYYIFEPNDYQYTILLSAGMNACELAPIFGLAYFIQEIMDNNIYNFKNKVRFIVIPVLCPSSFNSYPKKYLNGNGVRINKNFNYKNSWDTINVDIMGTKGPYADSENETLNLKKWLQTYANSNLWIDCHADLDNKFEALFCAYMSDITILKPLLKAQKKLKTMYLNNGYYTPKSINEDMEIIEGIVEELNYVESGTLYPKTLYAKEVYNIPSIMIEQFARSTNYGSTGTKQCESNSIKDYVFLLSQYCLEILLDI